MKIIPVLAILLLSTSLGACGILAAGVVGGVVAENVQPSCWNGAFDFPFPCYSDPRPFYGPQPYFRPPPFHRRTRSHLQWK